MHVKMLVDRLVTVDGVNTVKALEGEIYKMGEGVARNLIDAGHAEPAEAGATVNVPPPAAAPFGVSPSTLTFAGGEGTTIDSQVVSIAGEGEFEITLAGDHDAEWLLVDPKTGTAPAEISVSLDDELAAGGYSAFMTVTHGDATETVGVSVSIAAAGEPEPQPEPEAEPGKAVEEKLENKNAGGKPPAPNSPSSSSKRKTSSRSSAKKATTRKR
jgi:hypothetical protein